MDYVVGFDLGHRNVPEAERWIHSVVDPLTRGSSVIVCTHAVGHPFPHVTISAVGHGVRGLSRIIGHDNDRDPSRCEYTSPEPQTGDWPRLSPIAARAAADHAERRSGRAVIYPGVERLTGTLPIEEVLAASAIERVVIFDDGPPGATEPRPDAKLDTRGYVRPQWSCGRLTLLVIPAPSGGLVPFEGP